MHDFFATHKKEMLELLCELISKPTVNPPGNERLAANVLVNFFEKSGIEYEVFEKAKGRSNVIAHVGKGIAKLLIPCHLDVVPAGDGWLSEPFKPVIKDGKVYGRGASDNKGQVTACAILASYLKSKKLKKRILFAFVADEERGSNYGMRYLLDEGLINARYAIVPDVGGRMREIDIAEKGLLFLRLVSYGKQAHGSRPEKGINAIWNLIELLEAIKSHRFAGKKHDLLKDMSMNLGIIRGGNGVNTVPAKAEAEIDIRYLPGQNVLEEIKDIASKFMKNKRYRFGLEVMDNQRPIEISRKSKIIEVIRKCTKAIVGFEPRLVGKSGTTLVKPLAEHGIEAVGFGPGTKTAHKANEYIIGVIKRAFEEGMITV